MPLLQVFNVCTSPIVQNAWDQGQTLAVHGVVYTVGDGVLRVRMLLCRHAQHPCIALAGPAF